MYMVIYWGRRALTEEKWADWTQGSMTSLTTCTWSLPLTTPYSNSTGLFKQYPNIGSACTQNPKLIYLTRF